jgi:hypothetical protein
VSEAVLTVAWGCSNDATGRVSVMSKLMDSFSQLELIRLVVTLVVVSSKGLGILPPWGAASNSRVGHMCCIYKTSRSRQSSLTIPSIGLPR